MTVRSKIVVACAVFIGICALMATDAWRSQQRLSMLAINLYDQAFVTQDFLGRGTVAFERFIAGRALGKLTDAELKGPVRDIEASLDIAVSRVHAAKTKIVLQRLRSELNGLSSQPGERLGKAFQAVSNDFGRAAHRLSNDGLAQRDEAGGSAASARKLLLGTLAGALCGALVTGWALVRGVVPPLRQAGADMAGLCRGNFETEVHGTRRKDEIGDLCRSLGVFKQALLDNKRMETQAADALETRRTRQQALTKMSAEFSSNVAGELGSVTAAVTTLQTTATLLADRAGRMTQQSAKVGELAEGATESAQTVARVVAQLSVSSRDIAVVVMQSTTATRLMLNEAEQARGLVDELGDVAKGVGTVVSLISGIANQTNLLALNATIEAARAGDSGKGFAVVAGEVKALARQTAQATQDIAGRIEAVGQSAARAMQLIRNLAARIGDVEQSGATIAASVQGQGDAVGEINIHLQAAVSSIAEVAAGMQELQRGAQDNSGASGQVTAAAGDVQDRSEILRDEITYFTKATNEASDWRDFRRYECDIEVMVTGIDGQSSQGKVCNISRSGAAIRSACALVQGETCSIQGILSTPMTARVVQSALGMLRVQFSRDERAQESLGMYLNEYFSKADAA